MQTELQEAQRNYSHACQTIAAMHAAAVGEVRGPIRGVVEDVADLREKALLLEHLQEVTKANGFESIGEAITAARKWRSVHPAIAERHGLSNSVIIFCNSESDRSELLQAVQAANPNLKPYALS